MSCGLFLRFHLGLSQFLADGVFGILDVMVKVGMARSCTDIFTIRGRVILYW